MSRSVIKKNVSSEYRASIKENNKVAAKFADVPEAEVLQDIKSFVSMDAKDGTTPASAIESGLR